MEFYCVLVKAKKEIFLLGQKVDGFLYINPMKSVLSGGRHPVMAQLSVQSETKVTEGRHLSYRLQSPPGAVPAQQSPPGRLSLNDYRRHWLTENAPCCTQEYKAPWWYWLIREHNSGSKLSPKRPRRAKGAQQKGALKMLCQALAAATNGEPLRLAKKRGPYWAETRILREAAGKKHGRSGPHESSGQRACSRSGGQVLSAPVLCSSWLPASPSHLPACNLCMPANPLCLHWGISWFILSPLAPQVTALASQLIFSSKATKLTDCHSILLFFQRAKDFASCRISFRSLRCPAALFNWWPFPSLFLLLSVHHPSCHLTSPVSWAPALTACSTDASAIVLKQIQSGLLVCK